MPASHEKSQRIHPIQNHFIMKTNDFIKRIAMAALAAMTLQADTLRASIAYGSINNFDTVNDTGSEC